LNALFRLSAEVLWVSCRCLHRHEACLWVVMTRVSMLATWHQVNTRWGKPPCKFVRQINDRGGMFHCECWLARFHMNYLFVIPAHSWKAKCSEIAGPSLVFPLICV
jgi:hypothetical protein